MGHVRNMDAHLIIAVIQHLEGQRVVKVLGIFRVDSECQGIPEIATFLDLCRCYFIGNAVRCILHFCLESVRKPILRQYRVHLGIILARLTQNVHQMSARIRFSSIPAIDQCSNLKPGTDFQL